MIVREICPLGIFPALDHVEQRQGIPTLLATDSVCADGEVEDSDQKGPTNRRYEARAW